MKILNLEVPHQLEFQDESYVCVQMAVNLYCGLMTLASLLKENKQVPSMLSSVLEQEMDLFLLRVRFLFQVQS